MTGPNGAGAKFDKMLRSETLRKDDDVLRVLRKHAPAIAEKVEALDATFSALLAKLEKIELSYALHQAAAPTIVPGKEPDGEAILASMRFMSADARSALLNKLKQ